MTQRGITTGRRTQNLFRLALMFLMYYASSNVVRIKKARGEMILSLETGADMVALFEFTMFFANDGETRLLGCGGWQLIYPGATCVLASLRISHLLPCVCACLQDRSSSCSH